MLLGLITILITIYLFVNSNGAIEYYEVRKDILSNFIKEYMIDYVVINNSNYDLYSLQYPVVFKPIKCSRSSFGVSIINNYKEGYNYLKKLKKTQFPIMAQKYYFGRELTIMYEKHPITEKINLILVERIVNNINDSKQKKYIWNEEHYEYNKIYVTRNEYITEKLKNKIKEISDNLPNVNVCRYDIKFNDIEKFKNGEDINIIEVNLSGGFDLRVHTKKNKLVKYGIRLNYFIKRLYYGILKLLLLEYIDLYTFFFKILPSIFNLLNCK